MDLLSDQVPNARGLALGGTPDHPILYVGSYERGDVYAVVLEGGRAQSVHRIAHGLDAPIGVAWHDGALYVSAIARIIKFPDIDHHLDQPPTPVTVTDALPHETHHGGRYIGFGPDGWLYFNVGAPCNVCAPDPDRYASIQRIRPDGGPIEVYARGIRNSVGFDWDPNDHTLWFTDNGRDNMGDDVPSDELNHAPHADMNFGFPYCHQGDVPDPEFGRERPCSAFVPPVALLGAHVASLGMRFYRGTAFPAEYRHSIFIAEHGSWNRSRKIGYRVARVEVDRAGHLVHQDVFASGWLQVDRAGHESVWGRPVDVQELPDGSLVVSDDVAGALYRITYGH